MVSGLVLSQGSNSNGNMKVSLKNPIIARDTNLIYFSTTLLFAHKRIKLKNMMPRFSASGTQNPYMSAHHGSIQNAPKQIYNQRT